MQLVERHVIKQADPRFQALDRAAFASKNLYNAANYVVRQTFIFQGTYLDYHEMQRHMQEHEAFRALPAKVAQWVLRLVDKNWQSFFAALAAWEEDPSKFVGRPRLPKYKDKQKRRNLLVYTAQALSAPALRQGAIVPSMLGITVQSPRRTATAAMRTMEPVARQGSTRALRTPDGATSSPSSLARQHAPASEWKRSARRTRRRIAAGVARASTRA
jgi:hypothetical protein